MAPARRWPLPLLMRVGWAGSVLFAGFFTVAPLVTLVVGGRFSVGTRWSRPQWAASASPPSSSDSSPALGDRVRLTARACVGAVGLRGALDRAGRRGCRAGGRAPSGSDRQRARGGRVSLSLAGSRRGISTGNGASWPTTELWRHAVRRSPMAPAPNHCMQLTNAPGFCGHLEILIGRLQLMRLH